MGLIDSRSRMMMLTQYKSDLETKDNNGNQKKIDNNQQKANNNQGQQRFSFSELQEIMNYISHARSRFYDKA